MKSIKLFILIVLMANTLTAQKFVATDTDSKIKFAIKNFGLTVDGTFSGVKGTILFDSKNIEKSEITLSINSNTVNTDNKERDKHLKKEDYFSVEKFPLISFTSTKITKKIGLNKFLINGNLTIKGITKPVEFEVTVSNKDAILTIKGTLQLNRKTYKVGGSSMVLSDNVKLNFILNCKEE
ncbi:YceI family protein [Flavobacterium sp.]|uniref:YceI family protein n=1 Tax=Flavobacterium sp. TaxID=239 RepID=UPI003753A35A